MPDVPARRDRQAKHAGMIFLHGGLESVTRALVMGDAFQDEPDGSLEILYRRVSALKAALEDRLGMKTENR